MNASRRATRLAQAALLGACLLGALAVVSGCSKKLTSVDRAYTTPEGAKGDAQLTLYPAGLGLYENVYSDSGEIGQFDPRPSPTEPGDVLLRSAVVYAEAGGPIHGLIVDGTVASAYQVLRRESNGGLHGLFDYDLSPTTRWLDSGYELYQFTDDRPSSFSPPTYVGRGVVQGAITPRSPLTNSATLTAQPIMFRCNVSSRVVVRDNLNVLEITVRIVDPVPGASGYWLQMYQFLPSASEDDKRLSQYPAPLSTQRVRDISTSFARPSGTTQMTLRGQFINYKNTYLFRISAVDTAGQYVGCQLGYDRKLIPVSSTAKQWYETYPTPIEHTTPDAPTAAPLAGAAGASLGASSPGSTTLTVIVGSAPPVAEDPLSRRLASQPVPQAPRGTPVSRGSGAR